jgi:co-chaperonin GroES (HSP10)
MQPLFDRVKFKLITKKNIESDLIHIDFASRNVPDEGIVTSIGEEVTEVKIGDRIKFTDKKTTWVTENDVRFGLIAQDDILLKIENEDIQEG